MDPANQPYVPKPRKYQLGAMQPARMAQITGYRDKYERYLRLHNNTAAKEVWKIYDHIASELMREQVNIVLQEMVTKDLDNFVE